MQEFRCRNLAPYLHYRQIYGGVVSIRHPYAPHTSIHPYTSICPFIPPVHLYVPPITYVPNMSWALGVICIPHMSWGLLGEASVHLSGIFVSVSTSICVLGHSSHASCSQSLWGAVLLDLMPMDACYASCCCFFLCSVFIMSQASTTTAMTTTSPQVTVVCSGMSALIGSA